MLPPQPNPLLGTALHAFGAGSAALCYVPQRYLHRWSWQTYWLLQACGCWLIFPWIFAWLTIPQLATVLQKAPGDAMLKAYLLGALYGVGGIAFGVAIRYVGYSLTYALAIGISCVLGTWIPPFLSGKIGEILSSHAGMLVLGGVLLGGAAMIVTGYAGFRREREFASPASSSASNCRIGLPLVALAGALSAVFNLSLAAAQPVADVAAKHGAGAFQGNVMYLFSNGGAFSTTLLYVGFLATRAGTWGEFLRTPDGAGLARNYLLSGLTGLLWYLQFLGHVRMGRFEFSSWAIHMILLIVLSCGFGLAIGEWKRARGVTKRLMLSSIALLLGAVGLISYGNTVAEVAR